MSGRGVLKVVATLPVLTSDQYSGLTILRATPLWMDYMVAESLRTL